MPRQDMRIAGAAAGPACISKLYLTSAAVTGEPSWKRACWFSRKLTDDLSGATRIDSASSPYMVCGSSPDITASVSNMKSITPVGAAPRGVKGLNLSKLVRRSGLRSTSVPPLGAFGFTQSRFAKPRGYLGSP